MKRLISLILIVLLFSTLSSCKLKEPEQEEYVAASNNDNSDTNHNEDTQSEIKSESTDEIEVPSKETDTERHPENMQSSERTDNTDKEKLPIQQESVLQVDAVQPNDDSNSHKKDHKHKTVIKVQHADDVENLESASHNYGASDCFIGKITDAHKIELNQDILDKYFGGTYSGGYSDNSYFRLNEDFPSVVFPLNAKLYIYTVEVVQSVYSVFVEQGAEIKVLTDVSNISEEYRKGQKYLMKGTLYQYENETVIRLFDQFRAKVNDSGTLSGLSQDASIFNEVDTLDKFIDNEYTVSIFEKSFTLPTEVIQAYGLKAGENIHHEKNKDILNKIITDGKKAIIADSDFNMQLKPTEAVK